jgi:catechol 2,3-dioxygenase-like lactoylglutathione lyase family enzyme
MKRLHVGVSVTDIERSVAFYATLFDAEPTVLKPDYAKWMLDDPRVNFSISLGQGKTHGVDHLGIQAETGSELAEISGRLKEAGLPSLDQPDANCCYARGDKTWVYDPEGVPWEAFHTKGAITEYGEDTIPGDEACCGVGEESAATPATAAKPETCCSPSA